MTGPGTKDAYRGPNGAPEREEIMISIKDLMNRIDDFAMRLDPFGIDPDYIGTGTIEDRLPWLEGLNPEEMEPEDRQTLEGLMTEYHEYEQLMARWSKAVRKIGAARMLNMPEPVAGILKSCCDLKAKTEMLEYVAGHLYMIEA